MFERFTNTARRVVVLSQGETRSLQQDHVGPHHLLLGVLTAENATAGGVLAALGVDPAAVRDHAVATYGRVDGELPGHIPFSDAAKKTLEHSLRESLALNHTYIGSEHSVLGMISDPSEDTASMRSAVGVDVGAAVDAIMARLGSPAGAEPAEP